jgi:hypothetical protein
MMSSKTGDGEVVVKTRMAWAREAGAMQRFSTARVRLAFQRRREAGWAPGQTAAGPRNERVVAVRSSHPLAAVVRQCALGLRRFKRDYLEDCLGKGLDTRQGADALARLGLAVLREDSGRVELRPAGPRLARLVSCPASATRASWRPTPWLPALASWRRGPMPRARPAGS